MDDLMNIGLSNALAAGLLALIAFAVGSFYRRPALVHGLWLLVLLKLVTPPLVRIPIVWAAPSESDALEVTDDFLYPETILYAPEQPVGAPSPEPAVVPVVPVVAEEKLAVLAPAATAPLGAPLWPRVLPLVWLSGSLAWFGLACLRLVRFHRLLRHAQPASAALQERGRRLAGRLNLTRCPAVGLLPGRLAPMLWAVGGSPRLLLPANLLDRLDDEHLDTLLVHELAHLRRRDHWVRALEFAVMGLYWWHPVVWYARRELREAEEQCCDAWVVSTLPGASRTYASALMDTLDFLSTTPPALPPLASGLGQVSDLKRRLTMILRGTTPRALSWPGCFAVLALGAFFLPLLPALHAQTAARDTPKKETIDKRVEEQTRAVDVERAKAELAKAEADLRAKMAQLQQARAALDAASANALATKRAETVPGDLFQNGRSLKELARRGAAASDRAAGGADTPMIRIEILVSAEGLTVEDLRKKLASVLPDKKPRITIQWPAADQADPRRSGHATPEQPRWRSSTSDNVARPAASNGRGTPAAAPATSAGRVVPPGPGDPPDQRINELERKLEKVLRELKDLRQEMKGPRQPTPRANPPAGDSLEPAPGSRQSSLDILPTPPQAGGSRRH